MKLYCKFWLNRKNGELGVNGVARIIHIHMQLKIFHPYRLVWLRLQTWIYIRYGSVPYAILGFLLDPPCLLRATRNQVYQYYIIHPDIDRSVPIQLAMCSVDTLGENLVVFSV